MIIILNASKVTYTSNGTQTVFSFPFDYLRKRFISVTAGDTALVYGTHYSVTNKEVTLANAVASGTLIVIERTTPTTRLVEWQDASVLTANDMTISEVQNLHILEEQNTFILNNAIYLNADKVWEGLNRRIANVSDPINDQDVVTLGYVNKNETGLLTKLKNAYDTYMADLLAKYTLYKDTLLSNYSSYTSNLKDDFTNYTTNMLAKYNEYMTSLLNTKDTYLANLKTKYDEYMDSLTLTITTASTTITGYMSTTKGYMDTASAKATEATTQADRSKSEADRSKSEADRSQSIANRLDTLNGVTGVATEAQALEGASETLVMTPKTTKSVATVLSDALTAFKGVVNKAGIGITTNNNSTPNVDTVDGTGFYYLTNPQGTMPDGITGGELLHIQFDDRHAHQMLFEFDPSFADRYYIRTKARGTWHAWRQFTKQGDTLQGNITGTASTSAQLGRDGNVDVPMTFRWGGKDGQPSWLWGSNDGINVYAYNPANFNVNRANLTPEGYISEGIAGASWDGNTGWIRYRSNIQICFVRVGANYATGLQRVNFPVPFVGTPVIVTALDYGSDAAGFMCVNDHGTTDYIAIGSWR